MMGGGWPAQTVVITATTLLSAAFAYRNIGLVGCWAIAYGPIVLLGLYASAGAAQEGVLNALLETVSYAGITGTYGFLVGVAARELRSKTKTTTEPTAAGTDPNGA